MKKIILRDDFTETDFRPADFLQHYIQQTKDSIERYFLGGATTLKLRTCPGCLEKEFTAAFQKFGLQYVECTKCHTLYINPRPEDDVIRRYYRDSEASCFWREKLPKLSAQKRAEKIIKPRSEWVLDSAQEYFPDASHYVDIHSNQYGYIDSIGKATHFKRKTMLDPFIRASDIRSHSNIEVIEEPLCSLNMRNEIDVVSLFEVVDHYSDVDRLLKQVHEMLRPNGLCFITSTLISGFDLQVLWDQAETLFPPDRLNVFSVEGFKSLFSRHQFECLEFSTPGILDLDLVENALQHNPSLAVPRFIRYLIENRGESVRHGFQRFLQESCLSSYARILLRKREKPSRNS